MTRMSIDIERLFNSETWKDCEQNHPHDALFHINLWCAASKQKPAGSIPNDDEAIRLLAHCKPEWWIKVRQRVLKKWVTSSDGTRLFHPVVVETLSARDRHRHILKTENYTADFEDFWRACLRHKMGGSKVEAWEVWRINQPARPEQDVLLSALEAYVADVRGKELTPRHPCRFLSKGYWEAYQGYLVAPAHAVHASWGAEWKKLANEIGESHFVAWMGTAVFETTNPPHIVFEKKFKRDWCLKEFGPRIEKIWPGATLEVRAQ